MQLSQLEKVFCTPATRSLTSAACEAMLSFSFSFSLSSLFSLLCLDREYSYAVLVSLFHIQYAWQY